MHRVRSQESGQKLFIFFEIEIEYLEFEKLEVEYLATEAIEFHLVLHLQFLLLAKHLPMLPILSSL